MKKENKNKPSDGKYDILVLKRDEKVILKNMKKNYYLLIISALLFSAIFNMGSKSFALDSVSLRNDTLRGKLEMVSDGLIIINQKGVNKSFTRVENRFDIYSDYITYRISPFSFKTESTPCKVLFLDKFIVRFKTPNSSSIEMNRYRIKDLNINIK